MPRLDFALYKKLWRDELLNQIPLNENARKSKFGDTPLNYYHQHHEGITRGVLYEINPGLCAQLKKRGDWEKIPLKVPKRRSKKKQ